MMNEVEILTFSSGFAVVGSRVLRGQKRKKNNCPFSTFLSHKPFSCYFYLNLRPAGEMTGGNERRRQICYFIYEPKFQARLQFSFLFLVFFPHSHLNV